MFLEDKHLNGTTSYWSNKSDLEKAVGVGLSGPPELRKSEKNQFLGEFQERVIKSLTKNQVRQPGINPEVEKAVRDPRATAVIVHGEIPFKNFSKYEHLAEKNNLGFTIRRDPDFTGEVGLVVISEHALT